MPTCSGRSGCTCRTYTLRCRSSCRCFRWVEGGRNEGHSDAALGFGVCGVGGRARCTPALIVQRSEHDAEEGSLKMHPIPAP